MYENASKLVEAELQKSLTTLPHQFAKAYTAITHQIEQESKLMIDKHSAANHQAHIKNVQDQKKIEIYKELQPQFEMLEMAWERATKAKVAQNVETENAGPDDDLVDDFSDDDLDLEALLGSGV